MTEGKLMRDLIPPIIRESGKRSSARQSQQSQTSPRRRVAVSESTVMRQIRAGTQPGRSPSPGHRTSDRC